MSWCRSQRPIGTERCRDPKSGPVRCDNTIETFCHVRSVKAELVFELAFEAIQRSTRHKSGVAVRFHAYPDGGGTKRQRTPIPCKRYLKCSTHTKISQMKNDRVVNDLAEDGAGLYPHLKIMADEFPRLLATRRDEGDGAEYFGAFLTKTAVHILIDFLNRKFRLAAAT